jgi:hypothetical protein
MIIMAMADQHHVDLGQVIKADAGLRHACWPDAKRPRAPAPDGVGQNVEALCLNEDGGMPYPRRDHLVSLNMGCGFGRRHRDLIRPFGALVGAG